MRALERNLRGNTKKREKSVKNRENRENRDEFWRNWEYWDKFERNLKWEKSERSHPQNLSPSPLFKTIAFHFYLIFKKSRGKQKKISIFKTHNNSNNNDEEYKMRHKYANETQKTKRKSLFIIWDDGRWWRWHLVGSIRGSLLRR